MDKLFEPPSPQERKPKRKPKSIFDDEALLFEKGREYAQMYSEWQRSRNSGDGHKFLFEDVVAAKLKISAGDAKELIRSFHSGEFGEFEADHIRNTPHISIDHSGNEIPKMFDPFDGL